MKVRTSELLMAINDVKDEGFDYTDITETSDSIVITGYKKTSKGYESCEIKSLEKC